MLAGSSCPLLASLFADAAPARARAGGGVGGSRGAGQGGARAKPAQHVSVSSKFREQLSALLRPPPPPPLPPY